MQAECYESNSQWALATTGYSSIPSQHNPRLALRLPTLAARSSAAGLAVAAIGNSLLMMAARAVGKSVLDLGPISPATGM
jgi:hypothetical protein